MKFRAISSLVVAVMLALPALAQPATEAFTYQGRVRLNGSLVTTATDFEFSLWNHPTSTSPANQVGGTLTFAGGSAIVPDKGLFTATLNFGTGAFDGNQRWLQVKVKNPSGVGGFVTVTPRQPITPSPYAVHALNGGEWTASGNNVYFTGGNVGIGTSNPASALTVNGSIEAQQGVRVVSGNVAGRAVGQYTPSFPFASDFVLSANFNPLTAGIDSSQYGTAMMRLSSTQGTSTGIALLTGGAGAVPSTRMVIDQFGRVDVMNDFHAVGTVYGAFLEATGPSPFIDFRGSANPDFSFRIGNDASGLRFQSELEPDILFLRNDGLIGINNVTPTSRLSVNGSICATNNIVANNGSCDSSDGRLKHRVRPILGALAIVQDLHGIQYEWRHEEFPERSLQPGNHIGFIAQDIQAVLPEAVITADDGYLAVNYGRLTPVLVEAVKELHGIVQTKDDQLAAQQAQLEAIQSQLDLLRRQMAEQAAIIQRLQEGKP